MPIVTPASVKILAQITMSSPVHTTTSGKVGAGDPSVIVKTAGVRPLIQPPTLHSA